MDQIADGKLEDYDVLYFPFSFMLSRAAAAGIEEFVRQGVVVVAEARTAWNDEAGYCGEAVPGLGLERVFGCRERGTLGLDEDTPCHVGIVRDHPALPLLTKGDVLVGARFREEMEVLIFFAFNHTDQPTQPEFSIALPQGDYAATDVITGKPVPCRQRNGWLVLAKPLKPQEIWVVKIISSLAVT